MERFKRGELKVRIDRGLAGLQIQFGSTLTDPDFAEEDDDFLGCNPMALYNL